MSLFLHSIINSKRKKQQEKVYARTSLLPVCIMSTRSICSARSLAVTKRLFICLAARRLSTDGKRGRRSRYPRGRHPPPRNYPGASRGTSGMDGGDGALMKAELVRRRSQPVITVTRIHRRRRLLATVMSKRRPLRASICSCSPSFNLGC